MKYFFLFSLIYCVSNTDEPANKIVDEYLKEGNKEAELGNYSGAVYKYENILKIDPLFKIARRNLGIVLVKSGNFTRAKSILTSIEENFSDDIDVIYYIAEAYRGLNQHYTAIKYYRKALNINRKDKRILKALAWSFAKINKHKKSIKLTEILYSSDNSDLQLKLILAFNYNKNGTPEKTIGLLNSLSKMTEKEIVQENKTIKDKILILNFLADAHRMLNSCDIAINIYEKILNIMPLIESTLTNAAKCDISLGRISKAKSKLEKAAKINPKATETFYLLGRVYENIDISFSKSNYNKFLGLAKNSNEYSNRIKHAKERLNAINSRYKAAQ